MLAVLWALGAMRRGDAGAASAKLSSKILDAECEYLEKRVRSETLSETNEKLIEAIKREPDKKRRRDAIADMLRGL